MKIKLASIDLTKVFIYKLHEKTDVSLWRKFSQKVLKDGKKKDIILHLI